MWDRYRASNPKARAETPISFHFCDNQEDADLCAALVVRGQKRATAPSVAELELAGDPVPRVGDYSIVTDWAGHAVAVIQTVSVEIRRFGEIDEEFARAEGEGDLTLEWWRTAHQSYYE
ncbi:MAG: ASCH domain-containing protein, partial [Alphaproteobacteria bacterium]